MFVVSVCLLETEYCLLWIKRKKLFNLMPAFNLFIFLFFSLSSLQYLWCSVFCQHHLNGFVFYALFL